MGVDVFLAVLIGASVLVGVLIIVLAKRRGKGGEGWLDETRGWGDDDGGMDD
jgi:hypothetical protein